jgi:ribosomal protein S14
MNKLQQIEKDRKVRFLFKKKELLIVLFKYGILMNKEKKYKNYYYLNFIKRFHLNWSSSRVVNRCLYTSRAHWPLRRFRLSRMMFKNLFDENEGLMGVKRASW